MQIESGSLLYFNFFGKPCGFTSKGCCCNFSDSLLGDRLSFTKGNQSPVKLIFILARSPRLLENPLNFDYVLISLPSLCHFSL